MSIPIASIVLFSLLMFLIFPSDPYPPTRPNSPQLHPSQIVYSHAGPLFLSNDQGPQDRLRLVDLRFARRFDGLQREELGLGRSPGSRVRARGSSCVDATLELDGLEVIHDVLTWLRIWLRESFPLVLLLWSMANSDFCSLKFLWLFFALCVNCEFNYNWFRRKQFGDN